MEYGDIVWDNCTLEDKKLLENIQLECARIVTGATKFVSIEKLYLDLGWETLQKRRNDHKLFMFYKIINNLVPMYLNDLVPLSVRERTNNTYPLRNALNFSIISSRTSLYKNSYFPSTCELWNTLPMTTRTASSFSNFRSLISKPPPKKPLYYNIGLRANQIYHTRIRLECSSLKDHLYKAHLVDNPFCECGASETPEHFFLHCPRYAQQRLTYFDRLPNLNERSLVKCLLSGNSELNEEENKDIFIKVQSYIKATKRFQTNG